MNLELFKNKFQEKIIIVAAEVQGKVNMEFQKLADKLDEDSPLNQVGLRDGFEIVKAYSDEGEYGVAFEHLLYMIDETGVLISKASSKLILEMSEQFDIPVNDIEGQLKV